MKRLAGVDKVDMKTKERNGGIYVTFKSGVLPDVPKALELIQQAGSYKPRATDVFLTVTGTVANENGQFILNLDKMKTPAEFALLPSDGKDSAETFAKVKEFALQSSTLVELEGQWQPNAEANNSKLLPALKVTNVVAKSL